MEIGNQTNKEVEVDLKSGYDILWVLFLIDVGINLLAFLGSVIFKNYKNFDLIGSFSYIGKTTNNYSS